MKANERFGTSKIRFVGFGSGNDFNKLNSELANGKPVILEEPGHYIIATGKQESTFSINDPRWQDKTTLASYGNTFKSSRLYELTSTDLSTIYITTPSPIDVFLIDSLGRKVGKDPDTGIIYNEIPNSFYLVEDSLLDDTFEDTPLPDNGVTTLAIVNPNLGEFTIRTSNFSGTYEISFAGYDRNGEISTQDFLGRGHTYSLNYSPEPGSQIQVTQIVDIDIKPGSHPNSINLNSNGVIPVAILTTPSFDATQVDVSTVKFGPGEAKEIHNKGHFEDVDSDGDTDLVLHFKTQETGIQDTDTQACLTGDTLNGTPIGGCDALKIIQ